MKRTAKRPIPLGIIAPDEALAFAVALGVGSVALMALATNFVAAFWLAVSILFYVVVYTAWLKRRTPQNIVIGGAAGAFPVIVGWAAVTGDTTLLPWLLFAIIFLWTAAAFLEPRAVHGGRLCQGRGADAARHPWHEGDPAAGAALLAVARAGDGCARRAGPDRLAVWRHRGGARGGVHRHGSASLSRSTAEVASRYDCPRKNCFGFSLYYLAAIFAALVADRLILP